MIVRKKAFTLIEILISLTLLSLMMGLVFFSIQKSRADYRCQSFLEKMEDIFVHLHNKSFENHQSYRIVFDFSLSLVLTKKFLNKQWSDFGVSIKIPSDLFIDTERMEDQKKKYVLTIDRDGVSDDLKLFLKRKEKFLFITINTKEGFSCETKKMLL